MSPTPGARRPCPRAYAPWLLSLAATLLLAVGAALAQWDLESILSRAEQRYGELGAAKSRLGDWGRLLEQGGTLDEAAKLHAVNDFFNRSLRFTDDIEIWQQEDYWATPVEALVKGAADCEDYAIAKYVTLRRLGVASDKLRITYVKALRLNQAHMVLTWYASPGADPLVLDNLIGEIRPASQRDDLLPVYAFNAEGLWLPGADGGRRIGRHPVAGGQQHHVARYQAFGVQRLALAVAQDQGMQRKHVADGVQRVGRLALLDETDQRVDHHRQEDYRTVHPEAEQRGDQRGEQHHVQQDVVELPQQAQQRPLAFRRGQPVVAVRRQAAGGLVRVQAGGGAVQSFQHPLRRAGMGVAGRQGWDAVHGIPAPRSDEQNYRAGLRRNV